MAEQEPTAEQLAQIAAENEEDEHSVNYKPPAQKSIQEIQELDKDDESLRKYKEALLGRVAVSADPNVPNVVVTRLILVCSTAPGPLELDLTGDLESFKKQSFVLKEGVEYRIKISFRVNREIVSGMKYIQHTYRKGVKIDKTDYMVSDHMSWQDGTHRAGYLLAFLTRALVGFWSLGAGLGNGIKCHFVQQLAQT
ncbi:Rho GDP-dissociation inhibitor 1, partial [Eschrichtius robustus]|nr:Rho GDP-dissociation inhibitor 1 [Eschrichtius robustus]